MRISSNKKKLSFFPSIPGWMRRECLSLGFFKPLNEQIFQGIFSEMDGQLWVRHWCPVQFFPVHQDGNAHQCCHSLSTHRLWKKYKKYESSYTKKHNENWPVRDSSPPTLVESWKCFRIIELEGAPGSSSPTICTTASLIYPKWPLLHVPCLSQIA